ncbi:biotin carboxylase [Variovorax boronicumulans]|nr:biotin carboxylase [Variovorax boronicumulans]
MADHAVAIGPASPAERYLNHERILAAAAAHGAEGEHSGYGFLSENTVFARAAEAVGVVWIGPTPQSIEEMGDKKRAREIAKAAGVPTLPGQSALRARRSGRHRGSGCGRRLFAAGQGHGRWHRHAAGECAREAEIAACSSFLVVTPSRKYKRKIPFVAMS